MSETAGDPSEADAPAGPPGPAPARPCSPVPVLARRARGGYGYGFWTIPVGPFARRTLRPSDPSPAGPVARRSRRPWDPYPPVCQYPSQDSGLWHSGILGLRAGATHFKQSKAKQRKAVGWGEMGAATSSSSNSATSVHDFSVKDGRGQAVDLSIYKGKLHLHSILLHACSGLTNSNYTQLSQLYHKFSRNDVEFLAFPCNQFGGQEPGTNDQIQEFACTRFKAEYPIFHKVNVNGDDAAPLYKFLKASKGGFFGEKIKWNFTKFLVDKEGRVVKRYAPTTSPLSVENDIKQLLEGS